MLESPSPQLVASTKLDTAHDGQLCNDATDDPRPLDSRVWRGFFYASEYEHNPALYVESAGSSTVIAHRITGLVATIVNYNCR